MAVAGGATWTVTTAAALAHPPASYAHVAAALRSLVPPGEPVACPMREWFAFAGRNPAYTFEFRSIPPFHTSVMALIREQRPRYLVLHLRSAADGDSPTVQRYHYIYPPWDEFYAFVDRQTVLVGMVSDPVYGTEVVRRVMD